MMYEPLLYDIEDGICTITLNRPESLNALNGTMLNELPLACEQAAADNDVRVVILTGAGRLFCAGGDLKDTGRGDIRNLEQSSLLLADQPGARLGAVAPDAEADDRRDQWRRGRRRLFELTLACDLRYMSTTAYLYTAFLKGRVLGRLRRHLAAAPAGGHGQGSGRCTCCPTAWNAEEVGVARTRQRVRSILRR